MGKKMNYVRKLNNHRNNTGCFSSNYCNYVDFSRSNYKFSN